MATGTSTLMIMTMISIGLGIMGYSSYGATSLAGWPNPNVSGFINGVSVAIGVILTASVVVGLISSNFALIYSVPMQIFDGIILILFIGPLAWLGDPSLPIELKAILGGVFGVMILMTMMSFLRGGEV